MQGAVLDKLSYECGTIAIQFFPREILDSGLNPAGMTSVGASGEVLENFT
jgi:hypothetical protein